MWYDIYSVLSFESVSMFACYVCVCSSQFKQKDLVDYVPVDNRVWSFSAICPFVARFNLFPGTHVKLFC